MNRYLSKFLVGSTTPTGVVFKRVSKYFESSITPGPGVVIRRPGKLLLGTIEPGPSSIGALLTKNFRSDLLLEGQLRKNLYSYFAGSTTPTGAVAKQPKKFLSGIISGEGGGASIIRRIRRLVVDD